MRILIVRLSALGDLIHALPVALNAKRAGCEVGWLTEPRYAPLLAGNPSVDRVFTADTRAWRRGPWRPATVRAVSRLRASLREFGPDLTLDVQGLWKSASLARLAGAPVAGFRAADRREPESAVFCDQPVPLPRRRMHVVDRNLSLLEGAGFPVSVRAPDARYILGSKAERPAIPLFRLPERFAVYHPGADSRKAWGEEGFASLAGRLYDGHGLYPVISWGPGEDGRAIRVAASLPVAAVTPPLDVLALARTVAGASLFVAGDTGPLHLADALGVPTICLFAGRARNPAWRNGPYGGWSADQGAGIESLIDLAVRACREKVSSAGSR